MTNKLTHHHLTAQLVNNEHDEAIVLTQQKNNHIKPSTVVVHPWQLRAVCEQFGILSSDPQAAKTVATLQRRMEGLRERIDGLTCWMAKHSDHEHADLTYGMTQLWALRDLADEWCADFEEDFGEDPQPHTAPPKCTSAPSAQASLL